MTIILRVKKDGYELQFFLSFGYKLAIAYYEVS